MSIQRAHRPTGSHTRMFLCTCATHFIIRWEQTKELVFVKSRGNILSSSSSSSSSMKYKENIKTTEMSKSPKIRSSLRDQRQTSNQLRDVPLLEVATSSCILQLCVKSAVGASCFRSAPSLPSTAANWREQLRINESRPTSPRVKLHSGTIKLQDEYNGSKWEQSLFCHGSTIWLTWIFAGSQRQAHDSLCEIMALYGLYLMDFSSCDVKGFPVKDPSGPSRSILETLCCFSFYFNVSEQRSC